MKRLTARKLAFVLIIAVFVPCSTYGSDAEQKRSWNEKPVSSQEIEQVKREITDETRSSIEGIFDYHSETGDLNNRLDFWRYGGRLNLRSGGMLFYLGGTRTLYHTINHFLDESGTGFTAGLKGTVSDLYTIQFEIGATNFSTHTTTVNALGSITVAPSDRTSFYVTGSRTNVEESLLSATGIRPVAGPFAGTLVGNVMDNRIVGGGRHKFDGPFDVYAEGGFGTRAGSHVDSNFFKKAGGGIGYSLLARPEEEPLSLVRASYSLDYFGFNDNRLGFGGASLLTRRGVVLLDSLGSDGISPIPTAFQPGVGGYFSPQRFLSNTFHLELKGRAASGLTYRVSAFAGWQSFTGSSSRTAAGVSGSLILRLGSHLSFPVTYARDNFGPYTQQTFFGRLAVSF